MRRDDQHRIECVDRWLDDVSGAARRWKTVKAAQQSAERVMAYLEEISRKMRGESPDLDERMAEAMGRFRENASRLADEALRLSELESGFYAILPHVEPPEVAEAWRMRCIEHKTWSQCSMSLHYNRQHLERLSKRAKAQAYPMIPRSYRDGD